MDAETFKNLKRGDIVRHVSGSNSYIVDVHYGTRVTAVRTLDMTNPSEWIKINKS